MVERVVWATLQPLFRFSPRPAFRWRAWLLRRLGAHLGNHVHIYPSVRIFLPSHLSVGDWSAIGEHAVIYNLGPITIGSSATVSQQAHLCAGTHDYRQPDMPLLKPPITIGDNVWICADAFIGPNVTVGNGAIVGARAVLMTDLPEWQIAAGNPARIVKARPRCEVDDISRSEQDRAIE